VESKDLQTTVFIPEVNTYVPAHKGQYVCQLFHANNRL